MGSSEGYTRAVELLHSACTPAGFVASPREKDNYKRVWTRDGVVCGLAALLTGSPELTSTFRRTLQTIFDNQHPSGFVPSNVSADGRKSYGGTVGRADNPSWAVIGLCQYVITSGDHAMARTYRQQVERCFHVMDIWEYNGKDLIYVPQSGDWADEYFYHGYLLFDQLLRVLALRLAAKVFQLDAWEEKAEKVQRVIQINFWNDEHTQGTLYAPNLAHQRIAGPRNFWFMGFNPSKIYRQFDLQANALALLLGIGTDHQNETVLTYIRELCIQYNAILPSFYPSVNKDDPEMHELTGNFAYGFRNFPNQFHNGGLWPVWNGFLVAGLATSHELEVAHQLTYCLHAANASGNWMFNECLDGSTRVPAGVPYCSWSAAGAVIAENVLKGKRLFDIS